MNTFANKLLVAFVVVTAVHSFASENGDVLAIAVIATGYFFVNAFTVECAKSEKVLLHGLVSLYVVLALVNSFYVSLPGTLPDSWTFHRLAAEIAEEHEFRFGVDYVFYSNSLAFLYALSSESYFLGSATSILAMALSLVLIKCLSTALEIQQYRIVAFILCGMMPTYLFIGVAPMREAWQILFLSTSLYYGVVATEKPNGVAITMMIITSLLFGMFHKGMLFVAVINVVVFAVFMLANRSWRGSYQKLILPGIGVLLLAGFVFYVVLFTEAGEALVTGLFKDPLLWSIWHYRTSVDNIGEPNTAYNIVFEYSSIAAGVLSILKAYAYYMFYPLTISDFGDVKAIYAAGEVWFRIVAIAVTVAGFVRFKWRKEPYVYALVLVYITMTFVWSVGTTNYGQAIRHHLLDNWILIFLALEAVASMRRTTKRTTIKQSDHNKQLQY